MQIVFYLCAAVLLLAVGTGAYLFRQLDGAPAPTTVVTPVGVTSVAAAPSAGLPSADELGGVLDTVYNATVSYQRDSSRPFTVDDSLPDGGLDRGLVVPYIRAPLAGSASVFWRVTNGAQGLVLCAQYLEPQARGTVENSLIGAAERLGFALETSVCGQSALGVSLRKAVPVSLPPPPLVSVTAPLTPAALEGAPQKAGDRCQVDSVVQEKLMRML